MSSDHPTGHAFAEIPRERRLADKVADALTESILSGQLAVGARLPSERELCTQFAVSRPVVREAVRSLIARRLLADHPRRGHVVAQVAPESVSESLTLYVRGRPLDYAQISEIRAVLEVETAARAALRATDEQIEGLRIAAERLTVELDAEAAALADVEFHRAIAAATGNEFFVMLLDSLRQVLLEVQRPTLSDPQIVQTARAAHLRIFDAIGARDADSARAAMKAHLQVAEAQMRDLVSSSGGAVSIDP
jgi:DNA-binding FadR family transcriptional regulator